MKKLIPVLIGVSVLFTPQLNAIADERKTQVFHSNIEQSEAQLLSRAAHYRAWKMRGDEAFTNGNFDRAIVLYDQAISIDSDQVAVWESRGDALVNRGDYQAAIEAYNEAMNITAKPQTEIKEKIEATREKLGDQLSS